MIFCCRDSAVAIDTIHRSVLAALLRPATERHCGEKVINNYMHCRGDLLKLAYI